MRYATYALMAVTAIFGVGCSFDWEEALLPNEEPRPVDLAKMDSTKLQMRLQSDEPIELSDAAKQQFLVMLKSAERLRSPKGRFGSDRIVVSDTNSQSDLAKFAFDPVAPRIANDGREYILHVPKADYADFLKELPKAR